MLTISLHGIRLHANIGLYPEEKIKGNDFETDVDVWVNTEEGTPFPFYDYALIHDIVAAAFKQQAELLEQLVQTIHSNLKKQFPEATKIKVTVRKLQPPLASDVRYSQVSYEG
jgi:dihydroneopterin aldolase